MQSPRDVPHGDGSSSPEARQWAPSIAIVALLGLALVAAPVGGTIVALASAVLTLLVVGAWYCVTKFLAEDSACVVVVDEDGETHVIPVADIDSVEHVGHSGGHALMLLRRRSSARSVVIRAPQWADGKVDQFFEELGVHVRRDSAPIA